GTDFETLDAQPTAAERRHQTGRDRRLANAALRPGYDNGAHELSSHSPVQRANIRARYLEILWYTRASARRTRRGVLAVLRPTGWSLNAEGTSGRRATSPRPTDYKVRRPWPAVADAFTARRSAGWQMSPPQCRRRSGRGAPIFSG